MKERFTVKVGWGYAGQMDVDRQKVFCHCHRNFIITFVCRIQKKKQLENAVPCW